MWRALCTLRPGWAYFLSIPLLVGEFACFVVSCIYILSLWSIIKRPPRRLDDMLPADEFPHVCSLALLPPALLLSGGTGGWPLLFSACSDNQALSFFLSARRWMSTSCAITSPSM